MGSKGIRRRKRVRHLPKVRGDVELTYDHPDPYTPMGAVAGVGAIARATHSRYRSTRRRALILWGILALPLFAAVVGSLLHAVGAIS